MNNSNNINDTLFMNSIKNTPTQNTTTRAKSVLEKIKSLSSKSKSTLSDKLPSLSDKLPSLSDNSNSNLVKSILKYLLIFFIIIFLLLNILVFFNLLPEKIINVFRPLLIPSSYNIEKSIRQPIEKKVEFQQPLTGVIEEPDNSAEILEQKTQLNNKSTNNDTDPEPIETSNGTNQINSNNSGYCYIGEDRGYRSCIKVSEDDKCMSGDIFPREDVCINPNLRY